MGTSQAQAELKEVIRETSRALARLDADRLEELLSWCQSSHSLALHRNDFTRQAGEAAREMAIFARVLDATRANVAVMNRLRALRTGDLEYGKQLFSDAAARDGDGID